MRRQSKQLHIFYRLTAVLCAFLLLCSLLPITAVSATPLAEGKTGSLTWSLSGGILSITGKGDIPDYTEQNPAPWYEYRDSILCLELDDRITAIGKMAFHDHKQIQQMSLPASVTTIGEMAFAGCEQMTAIAIPQVTSIGRYAFSRCFKLDDVALPDTLKTLESYAFYRCESLTYMRIPASVTTVGGSLFAYCSSLLRVDVDAPLEFLPEWFFYGCERLTAVTLPPEMSEVGADAFTRCEGLNYVYYTGDEQHMNSLVESIQQDLPGFTVGNLSSTPDEQPPVTDTEVSTDSDEMKVTETEVSTGTDLVVRVENTVTYPITGEGTPADPEKSQTVIHATVTGDSGWNALTEIIKQEEKTQGTFELEHGTQPPVEVQISLPKDSVISGEWLSDMRGRDAVITVTTADGSRWSIDCSMLKGLTFKNSYDLRYTLTPYDKVSEEHRKVVGSAACFWVTFSDKIDFPVTVEMFLDPLAVRQTATLYEDVWMKGLQQLQSVLIGQDGTAAFRMGNVNKGKRYVVALNVSGVTLENVVIPDNLAGEYGELDTYVPITDQYIITDVRGFLGMTMKEFTIVLACAVGGLAVVIAVVILVLSIISKRRTLRDVLSESQK